MSEFFNLKFENNELIFINQTKLPFQEEYIKTDDYNRIAGAIEKLEIRGAPAIGIAAAFALSLSLKEAATEKNFYNAYNRLKVTRPTAVNLFWALEKMKSVYEEKKNSGSIYNFLIEAALEIQRDDIDKCDRIASNGIKIFKKKSNVITHCNTGKLATGGEGTAFAVIKKAFENNFVNFVYADETRPLLQGSRLTAFELHKSGIPFNIITDSTGAFLMKQGKIDLAITGADRIASNGDSANKVGTYNLAVICKHHNIPFYIAAPTSTIDYSISNASEIPIEERNSEEVTSINGKEVTLPVYDVYNPSFDKIPANLITGIITEEGLFSYPYEFTK